MTVVLNVRAVLFDLDGTLVDSLPDIVTGLNRARADFDLPPADDASIRGWIGDGARRLVARSIGTEDEEAHGVAELYARLRAHYSVVSGLESRLYPGVGALLRDLSDRGFGIACVTNKPDIATTPLLDKLGVTELFGSVVCPETVDGRRKPAPDAVLHALRELDVAPPDALMVGDAVPDIRSARAAGVRVAAVLGGYGDPDVLRAAGPDFTLERTSDLRVSHS